MSRTSVAMASPTSLDSAPAPVPNELGVPEVARLFEIPEHRLRYWSQTGFIRPSVRRGGRVFYAFQDLIAVKVAKGLLDAGLPLQRVRSSLSSLRMRLPEVSAPLVKLRIRCDRERVLVSDAEVTFEAATGQLLLDFDVASLERDVAEVRALPVAGRADRAGDRGSASAGAGLPDDAAECFARGRHLEATWSGDPAAPEVHAAIRAYRRAVELDPDFAAASTNLGSLLADLGDLDGARDAFDEALRADPDQPEAQANLAELALRAGDSELAIAGFRQVLRVAPEYLEAHYGLARALLAVGGKAQALAHLERFCAAMERSANPTSVDPELRQRLEQARAVIEALRVELGR